MIEPFRHNSWATLRLLEFCREMDPGLLDATAPGAFGSIKEILSHLVGSEEFLANTVEGIPAQPAPPRFTSLDDLQERARWLGERWERCLEGPVHPERLVAGDRRGGRLVRVGTVLAQAVHSGNDLRAQVAMTLRGIGIEPPALDGWAYGAWLVDRAERQRRSSEGGL